MLKQNALRIDKNLAETLSHMNYQNSVFFAKTEFRPQIKAGATGLSIFFGVNLILFYFASQKINQTLTCNAKTLKIQLKKMAKLCERKKTNSFILSKSYLYFTHTKNTV